MTESKAQAPKRSALFSAAGKGILIGFALSLIWPTIRLFTGRDVTLPTVFLLHFVLLGVTGATTAAFYISSNGVNRRATVFSGMLASMFVGFIAGLLNTLVSPNLAGGNSLVYAIIILAIGFLGILAGLAGAWGTSLLPSTMFFEADTPSLAMRLGEEEVAKAETAKAADTSLNTVKREEESPAPTFPEAAATLDPTDDLRAEVQSRSFASDNIISTPWDENKSDAAEESFKPSWELDTTEESIEQETQEPEEPIKEEPAPDESYTPAWATSLRTKPKTETLGNEDDTALDSRLDALAAQSPAPLETEKPPEPIMADESAPAAQPQTRLQEAVALYEEGQKSAAQRMLAEIVRNEEPENALAWLWLAATLENDLTKKRFCVQRAITIDPGNQAAQEIAGDIEATILPPKP